MRRILARLAVTIVFGALAQRAGAQQVLVDRGVRAGDLWCFPLVTDSTAWVYLPSAARLANDEQGRPQFSFVRYVVNTGGDSAGTAAITEARGGGVLTFLVTLETPARVVAEATKALQAAAGDRTVTLRGPMIFADGRWSLVSSVLTGGREGGAGQVMASGRAPVLEGNRLALSFDLDPVRATLLQQSLAMATSDVSLVMDMTFAGLADAYDAELVVNWADVRKSQSFSAGGSAYFVSADVEAAFDDLRRSRAIELRTTGDHAPSQALLDRVYDRLLGLLFAPVVPERAPEREQGGLFGALGSLLGRNGPLSSRKLLGIGASVGYRLREMRSEGRSVLSFRHRAAVERHAMIAFNLGDFHRTHGSDAAHFRTVNLGDAAFQQREVQVGVDGALLPEFDRLVNSITVTLRKQHGSGEVTLRELVLDRANAEAASAKSRLVYGWSGDTDRVAWLGYDFRTRWSFKGGGVYETPWARSESPMIDLFAPYERRRVQLAGDGEALRARGVRAVVVEVDYPFFGERRRPQLVVRPGEPLEDKQMDVTLPLGQPEYEVTTTWQLAGGERRTAKRRETGGLVFVDEMP